MGELKDILKSAESMFLSAERNLMTDTKGDDNEEGGFPEPHENSQSRKLKYAKLLSKPILDPFVPPNKVETEKEPDISEFEKRLNEQLKDLSSGVKLLDDLHKKNSAGGN